MKDINFKAVLIAGLLTAIIVYIAKTGDFKTVFICSAALLLGAAVEKTSKRISMMLDDKLRSALRKRRINFNGKN
ncbi:MAG: hypothetical protein IJ889_00535 [Eubacterium sp.]|nr:hypothetical protein [Eubacterium sp.]MBR2247452.1 hypothetical protein [Bacilli bacterium]